MTPSRIRRLRRRRAIGNLSLLVSGILVAPFVLVAQKSVVLVVEGEQRQVTTFSGSVGDLLASTRLVIPSDAVVIPSPSAELGDGEVVIVDLFLPPGAPGTIESVAESGTENAMVMDLLDARERQERIDRIQRARAKRVAIERAKRAAERRAAEEAARRAAEEAARKAAEEAARKAAEEAARLRASSTIEGCTQDWKTRAGAEALIRCAVERWPVPGGADKAISVARCESGLWYRAGAGSQYVGIFQHSVYYWPDRAAAYGFAGFDPLNGRANIMVAIQYAHEHGWGAWSGCA
jgi:hypothetical protein